jgi:hypothetical protein
MFHYRAAHDAKISRMNMKAKCWQVRDKGKLLLTLMKELEGDAHISIEGDLRAIRLSTYPGSSTEPTAVLKPITFGTDFVVLPLARSASEKIYAALGETVPKKVLHVQIGKERRNSIRSLRLLSPGMHLVWKCDSRGRNRIAGV